MKRFVKNALWFVVGAIAGIYAFTEMQWCGFKNGYAYYKFKDGAEFGDRTIVNSDASKQEKEEETPE
jgi:uncharacterized membrane protein